MPEFISNCFTIGKLEDACKTLVKMGMADFVKDSRGMKEKKPPTNGTDPGNDGFGIGHYRLHLVTSPVYEEWEAPLKFWYDKRTNRAGIKITAECLHALLQTATIAKVVSYYEIKTDGKITPEKIALALSQITDGEVEVKQKKQQDTTEMEYEE